jgi:hypothetical protein
MDITALLVTNLLEGFKQLNTYLLLGLVASISALALERGATLPVKSETVTILGGFPALPRPTAQLLLVGIAFVAGLMASYSAEATSRIVTMLGTSPVRSAACTFPSVATAPIGVPILASVLPVLLIGIVLYRKWRSLREDGIMLMFLVFMSPYIIVALEIVRMDCQAS